MVSFLNPKSGISCRLYISFIMHRTFDLGGVVWYGVVKDLDRQDTVAGRMDATPGHRTGLSQ